MGVGEHGADLVVAHAVERVTGVRQRLDAFEIERSEPLDVVQNVGELVLVERDLIVGDGEAREGCNLADGCGGESAGEGWVGGHVTGYGRAAAGA